MRKVIFALNTTLDGFIEGPNAEMDWMRGDPGDWQEIFDQITQADTVLMGRATYQIWEMAWPGVLANPDGDPNALRFARWIDVADKVVFSHTLDHVGWNNTRLAIGDPAEAVAALKQEPGRNMILVGGAGIAQSFMRLGLIDEYRVKVNPVILGCGKPLYKDITERINLELVEARPFKSGAVTLVYRPAGA